MTIEDPKAIIKAFKKGFELEETYWTYRSIYLSSSKQAKGESAAALATLVEDLVNLCKWPDTQREQRHIDLFYHLTYFFDIQRYVQNETAREGGNLTWESLVNEAKHQERVGKEYARFRRENGDNSTPSYRDPALAADTVSRGFKRGAQPRSRMPSGGKGSQQQCDRCRKHNGCNGQKGTCPAWGKECGSCHGRSHYRAVCRKAAQVQASGGAHPKQQQGRGKAKSPGKPKKHTHSVVFKMVLSGQEGEILLDTDADQNSVTSGKGAPLSKAARRGNSVLSGRKLSKTALHTCNVFSCDSIHNTEDGTLDQCETDTDPSGRLCIMTDIQVRAKTTSRTHNIRVKVDPGANANLMPVHHFRTIFPYLCDSTGQPKENVLDKAESSFESYSGDNVTVIGQTKIYTKNIQTGKFLVTRIYVIARERGPILLSNAASQWLGLITVLCKNKTKPVGRFVASVTREETDGGEVEKYSIAETGDGPDRTEKSNRQARSQTATTAPKNRSQTKRAKTMASAQVDVTPRTTHSEIQLSTAERTGPDDSQGQNSVISGETGQQASSAKPGPLITAHKERKGKDGPKMKADSAEIPQRKKYRPSADGKTYIINNQGQLQCRQDPQDVTRAGSARVASV